MTYFSDLGNETMVTYGPHIRAIGWLDDKHDYPTGDSSGPFVEKLGRLTEKWYDSVSALEFGAFLGGHDCELCGRFNASGNIVVPAGDLLFIAPEMVLHYVADHRYKPPDEFIEAVMRSPVPGTPEFFKAIEKFRPTKEELELEEEQLYRLAAEAALQLGGSEANIQEAALDFFIFDTPETCDRIARIVTELRGD